QVMKMLMEIGEEERAIPYIKEKLANKEKIMGMGHRVYRKGDPRAKHLKRMSKELTKITGQPKWYNISVKIDRKSTRLNSSHVSISYAVFCLKKKKQSKTTTSAPTSPSQRRASRR